MSNWKSKRLARFKKGHTVIIGYPPKLWYELRAQAGKLSRKKKLISNKDRLIASGTWISKG